MSQLIESPRPVPSPVGLVVKNGWNSLSLIAAGMPVPLSRTRISTASPRSRVATFKTGRKPSPPAAKRAKAAGGDVKPVAEKVQEHPRHVLRHQLDRRERGVKLA